MLNNTTNQQDNQLTPDEAAASLAFATQLSMPQKQEPMGEEPMEMGENTMEQPIQEPMKPEEKEPEETDTSEGLEEIKEEIVSLKEEIKKALNEQD